MVKLEVTTHSGETNIVEVETYNAVEITEMRNDQSIESIAIGNCSFSRIDLKNIKPIES
ncbi:hypothetical protein [Virgibacillus halodenitrificans]|uniref:hypothetical protein n=1 Tax=Virgibacillus halodenitrificans TaxID=1482 RepID=UPI000B07E7B2|nr:hypothetical protein [Virgibacillus halodenitrificans]